MNTSVTKAQSGPMEMLTSRKCIYCTLPKNCWTEVKNGGRIRIPKNYYGKISSRSPVAFGDVTESESTDAIKVLLRNDGDPTFII